MRSVVVAVVSGQCSGGHFFLALAFNLAQAIAFAPGLAAAHNGLGVVYLGADLPARDIVESVARGIDMFDCVLPTRSGRHGQAWSDAGPINIGNARFAEDVSPLDEALACPASSLYSKAYLHHLFKAGEILGQVLLSWHNLAYYQDLMTRLRAAIGAGRLQDFHDRFAEGVRASGPAAT